MTSSPPNTRSLSPLTVRTQLSRSRGFWIYVLLVIGVPLLQLHTADVGSERMSVVDTALSLSPILTVKRVNAWPAIEVGDRLVGVNGRVVESWPEWWSVHRELTPGPATFRFDRDGRGFDVTVELAAFSPAFRALEWFRYVVATLLMVIGLAAYLMRPGAKVSWIFTLYCLVLGVIVEIDFMSRDARVGHVVQWFAIPLGLGLGIHLFTLFPRPIAAFATSRVRTTLLYLPVVVFAPVASLLLLDGDSRAIAELANTAIFTWLAVGAIGGAALVVRQYVLVKREGDREGVALYRIVLFAQAGLLIPSVCVGLIATLHVFPKQPWLWQLSVAGTVVYAAGTAYALIRHNALGADQFTAAIIGYAATTALTAAAFGGALLGVPYLVGSSGVPQSPVFYIGVTVVLCIGFRPLYQQVRKRIDRWYLRERFDAEQSMDLLREVTQSIQSKTRDDALGVALDALKLGQPDGVALWTTDDTGSAFVLASGSGAAAACGTTSIPRDGALVTALKSGELGGVRHLAPRELSPAAQDELWALNLALAAPLTAHGALLGFVGVGRKLSGTAYRSSEQSFVAAIAGQISSILIRPAEHAQFGRYRIDRRLGVGGIAEVWLAWQIGPGGFERKVALKRPLPDLSEDPNCAAMFLDEARIASQLQHRNVVRVYEIDKHDGGYYIAMEFIDGPSLRTLIKVASAEGIPVPLSVAASIGSSILAALGHAHERRDETGRPLGIVHRDVTPGNVLLTKDGEVKLVDFGIARAGTQLHRTRTGEVRGTVPYMAPEHAKGSPLDQRADLYSAAAVIYELVTGKRAYPDGPTSAPPSRLADMPGALDAVLQKGLAARLDDRFRDADSFRIALAQAVAPTRLAGEAEIAAWMATVPYDGREHAKKLGDEPQTRPERPAP